MPLEIPRLSIAIVSEDWLGRSLFAEAASATLRFSRIIQADDGYTALAEIWQAVDEHTRPDIVLIDQNACDLSIGRLITEIRAAPRTQGIFIAAVADDVPPQPFGLDFVAVSGPLQPDLSEVILRIAASYAFNRPTQGEQAA